MAMHGYVTAKNEEDSLLKTITQNDTQVHRFEVYLKLSEQNAKSDITKALDYGHKAYLISKNLEQKDYLYRSLLNLSNVTFYGGLYDEAFQFSTEALTISKQIGNAEQTARALFGMGMFRLVLEDYEKAKDHFEKSMQLFQRQAQESNSEVQPKVIGLYNNNMGVIYRGLKDFELSRNILIEGIQLIESTDENAELLIQLYTNLGETYLFEKRFEKSQEAYLNALEITASIDGGLLMKSMVYLGLGELSFQLNELEEAYQLFFKSYKLAQKAGGISHLKHASKKLSFLFESTQQLDSAIVYKKLSEQYDQQLMKREAGESLTREEMKQVFARAEADLNNEIIAKKKNNILLIFGWIILLIVFIVVVRIIYTKYLKVSSEKVVLEKDHKLNLSKSNVLLSNLKSAESELAIKTMQEIKQKELIDEVLTSIESASSNGDSGTENFKKKLLSLKENTNNKQWSELEIRFNALHKDFFIKLNKIAPRLTKNERKLCMFIKLDMTTKEIISITGQSVRAVEIARTRLRKKLGITNSAIQLSEFLNDL